MIDTVTKYYFNGVHGGFTVTYVDSNIQLSVPLDEANTDYQAIQEWFQNALSVLLLEIPL